MATRKSFTATAAATFGTNVGVAVVSLLNVLVTARTLGPSGRGELALLTTIAVLTASLAAFGVYEANANIGGREPGRRGPLAANSLVLALALGGAAAAVVAALLAVFPKIGGGTDPALQALTLVAIPVLILQGSLGTLIQSQYGFGVTNVAWLLAPLTNLFVNGLFAALGLLTVGTAIVVWIAGLVVSTALLAWHALRGLPSRPRPDRQLAGRMLSFGARTHVGRVMTMGNYRFDQWFVGAIAGQRELGLYSVAVAWAEALFYLPTALGMVQRPDLVRASPSEAGARTAVVFRAALLLTALFAVAIVIAAPILCVTIFGEEFRGSIDDLRVLAFGAFGIVALKLLGNALIAQSKPMRANIGVGVAFVTTITLDLLLIPTHGGLGAAIASTAAYTAGGVAIVIVFSRTLGPRAGDLVPRGNELGPLLRQLRTVLTARPAIR